MKRNALLLAVAFCTILSQSAMAQSDIGFKRGGAALSIVSPDELDTAFGVGVFADLGTMAPRWGLEARLDWWGQSEEAFGAEASFSDITLGARTKYYFPTSNTNLRPFMGGGLGLHFLSVEVEVFDPFSGTTMSAEDSETRVGFDIGGGVATSLSPRTDLLAEAWYSIVSDFDQLSLRIGISQAFGN